MVDDLKERIESYVAGSKSRSLCKLAKDSNVPYSTIRRITQHEVSCVNQEIAVAILRVFATPEDIIKFIEDYYPESGKAFREFTSNLGSFAKRDVLDLIADYGIWYAVCLMEKKDGTSREALVNYLGEVKTQKVLDNLLTIDLIESDESGKLHLKNKNFSTSGSAAAILSIIRHITLSYEEEQRALPGHMLANLTTGWNEKGLTLVRETLKDAAVKLIEASKNPEYVGDITCAFGVIASVLDRGGKL
jgi:hypothetical protein